MESNPLHTQNSNEEWYETVQISLLSPFLNESHVVSLSGLVSISFAFSFQFFTRLAAVFAEEVGGFGLFEFDGDI